MCTETKTLRLLHSFRQKSEIKDLFHFLACSKMQKARQINYKSVIPLSVIINTTSQFKQIEEKQMLLDH